MPENNHTRLLVPLGAQTSADASTAIPRNPSLLDDRQTFLRPDQSAVNVFTLKFADVPLERFFQLSQACESIVNARAILPVLTVANLLYSAVESALLYGDPNASAFVFWSRTILSSCGLIIIWSLLHCVNPAIAEHIKANEGASALYTISRGYKSSLTEVKNPQRSSSHKPEISCEERKSPSKESANQNNVRHQSSSATISPKAGLRKRASALLSSPNTMRSLQNPTSSRTPLPKSERLLWRSLRDRQWVDVRNYKYLIACTTLICSASGSFVLLPSNEEKLEMNPYTLLAVLAVIHFATFELPWRFASISYIILGSPIIAAIIVPPAAFLSPLDTAPFLLLFAFAILSYSHYYREIRSRRMFWLLEKAKHDKLAVDNAASSERKTLAKSAFMENVSHEMRTPFHFSLNGCIGAASLLLDDNLSTEDVQHLAKVVHATAETLSILMNDVLDLASCEANRLRLRPARTNLFDLADHTISWLSPSFAMKRVDLVCRVDPLLRSREVMCDGNRLSQIIVNLLTNSLKFTNTGAVALTILVDHLDEQNNQATLTIAVEDTGMGIPAEALPHLGDRFYQVDSGNSKPSGTGLGLAITRALIEGMESFWNVTSTVGKGTKTTFTLRLPMVVNSARSQASEELDESIKNLSLSETSKNWHCMVVGGSTLSRSVFIQQLKDLGVTDVLDVTPAIEDVSHQNESLQAVSASRSKSDTIMRNVALQNAIHNYAVDSVNADTKAMPFIFVDEAFDVSSLGLNPKKLQKTAFSINDANDQKSASSTSTRQPQESELGLESDPMSQLIAIQLRHKPYGDKGSDPSNRSIGGVGTARPLFAETATFLKYEEQNSCRKSISAASSSSSPRRASLDSTSTQAFERNPTPSPVFWSSLVKPAGCSVIAKSVVAALSTRRRWLSAHTPVADDNPSQSLTDEKVVLKADPHSPGSSGGKLRRESEPSTTSKNCEMRKRSSSVDKDKPLRILLVEDNLVTVSVVRRMLEIAGFDVEVATDGESALRLYETSVEKGSAQSTYGAIMMDVQIGKMDGFTCSETIRRMEEEKKLRRRCPIIATSGREMDPDHPPFPFDAILSKPYKRAHLIKLLKTWGVKDDAVEPPLVDCFDDSRLLGSQSNAGTLVSSKSDFAGEEGYEGLLFRKETAFHSVPPHII